MVTPRKPKQRHHHQRQPTPLIQPSDYESDVNNFTDANIPDAPPPTRTNTELNLSVLRRYNPSIRGILSIAANAVVYLFTPSTQQWDKSGVEGTLFVCDQEPSLASGEDSFCIVVLNRRGLENIILDLGQTQDVEVANELLIMRFQGTAEDIDSQKVIGLWLHQDKHDTREVNNAVIQQCWEKARLSRLQGAEHAAMVGNFEGTHLNAPEPEPLGVGRRISLTDLFKQQGT